MKRLHEECFDELREKLPDCCENLILSQPKKPQCDSVAESNTGLTTDTLQTDSDNAEQCTPVPHPTHCSSNRFMALTAMIDQCSHLELVHLHEAIKPKLKRDFFALLPAELVFRVLSYLSLQDILHCAQPNWKSLYRTALETQCNWRHGSPWAPVVLPAHHVSCCFTLSRGLQPVTFFDAQR
ncbi:unnamed protein product [Echinostoma caproni]|uniref:F-box domain-containing protein n=1 Tax=Echinostoma caproni TaxID=27848 RepID=A0A183B0P8_9TREM|nr:unnamed protein product [Echinostoma caproni]